jgi:hypothetical protein
LPKFVGENISDFAASLLALTIKIISICVASANVAKASTNCDCRVLLSLMFCLKNITNGKHGFTSVPWATGQQIGTVLIVIVLSQGTQGK